MNKHHDIILNVVFYAIIFLVYIVFYGIIHPVVPFDSDDWLFISTTRHPYPSLELWNPTKLLPECLEPIIALAATYFLAPIFGDHLTAWIFANAATISAFITLYLYSAHKLIERKFHLSSLCNFVILIFFILLHFWVLRAFPSDNDYLWYSHDANCYYNYTIPNLLCASIVMWLMRHTEPIELTKTKGIFLLFSLYWALCSNLYSTVILIAYIGAHLTLDLIRRDHKEARWLRNYIHRNWFFLSIIALWLIVQIFESCGKRANAYGGLFTPFLSSLITTIKTLIHTKINHKFCFFSVSFLLAYCIMHRKKTGSFFPQMHTGGFAIPSALILSLSYLILLSSRVEPSYIGKGEVIFAFAFFYLFLVLLCICYLCSHFRMTKVFIPFMIAVAFFDMNQNERVFRDIQFEYGWDAKACIEFDRKLIQKVQWEESLGRDTVIIKVPKFEDDDNWPLCPSLSPLLSNALYKHNIIQRKMTIEYEIVE